MFFLNDKLGWAVGTNSTILATSNGGSTWKPISGGKGAANIGEGSPGYWDIFFINPKHGWVVGESGTIKMTKDGGKTWEQQGADITDSNLESLDFANETT